MPPHSDPHTSDPRPSESRPSESAPGAQAARAQLAAALPQTLRATTLARWDAHGPRLLDALSGLYATSPKFPAALTRLLAGMAACAAQRDPALRALDAAREHDPGWFLSPSMIGYSAYADRFAGGLRGVAARVPYLRGLGVRYLHLLPFLHAREGDNDGGFAVRDYDAVDPALGSDADLRALTAAMRDAGISLCADLVLNHTADDHRWAQAARAGDPVHRDYYHVFPDRRLPDAYERALGQVFPLTAPGNFTEVPGLGWVWTTFYGYQWDLDWSNPDVFAEMALILLRLANRGIEAFRLDSTAYLWKRVGTACMNLPQTHTLLQALRAVADIVAPGVLLKAEAIVPARELPPYFGLRDSAHDDDDADATAPRRECHLAYQSTLMAALWAGLAEHRGDLVGDVLAGTPALPAGCGWLTYLRCHDDIGWNVLRDEAAGGPGRAPFDLARIAAFYAGETAGSYARGRRFQSAGDAVHGSNGMTAALCGIDAARRAHDTTALAAAERRLRLLYGVALAVPGLPTLYMGDEIALGNDEGYADDPARAGEGRWLQRPTMDWPAAEAAARGDDADTAGRTGAALRRMLAARAHLPALRADAASRVLAFDDPALLGLLRGGELLVLCNFAEEARTLSAPPPDLAGSRWRDALVADAAPEDWPTSLPAHGLRWLQRI
jgi:amylosucrase